MIIIGLLYHAMRLNTMSPDHGRPINKHDVAQASNTGLARGRFPQCKAYATLSSL